MSYPVEEIEPGEVYMDRYGQRREVVELDNGRVTYRLLFKGWSSRPQIKRNVDEGQLAKMCLSHFARWAYRAVS